MFYNSVGLSGWPIFSLLGCSITVWVCLYSPTKTIFIANSNHLMDKQNNSQGKIYLQAYEVILVLMSV